MIFTITMNPAVDLVLRLGQPFEIGKVHRCKEQEIVFGGKGINVSRVLHTLGTDSIAWGFIAGFSGAALEHFLREQGIRTDFVRLPDGLTRFNVKLPDVGESELNGAGPFVSADQMEKLFQKLKALKAGDVLVLSGSVPPGVDTAIYGEILRRAKTICSDLKTVVDAGGDLLRNALRYQPDLIKPNRQELEQLWGLPLPDTDSVEKAARSLQKTGARNVLVSLGGEGAMLLLESGETIWTVCPQGKVLNPVAAGDSMVAGFLAGLQSGTVREALQLAVACGSAAAFSVGLPEKEMIAQCLHTFQR